MLKERSVCCSLDLQLYAALHDFWDKEDLAKIMRTCIILHNMIVEDERDTYSTPFGPLPTYDDATDSLPPPNLGE